MKIDQAIDLVGKEFDEECFRARDDAAFDALMCQTIYGEYAEIDRGLPPYVSEIARGHGVPAGTTLPEYVYQMARMCFRMGMRAQRKLDRPDEPSSMFWRSDQEAI
jgi:hypothetical protein